MNETYAARLDRVSSSLIMALVRKARDMAAAGKPVIDLGIGESDFSTPDHVKAPAIAAIQDSQTRYMVIAGTPDLHRAFYVFPSCAGAIGRRTPEGQVIASDMDFCEWLLDHCHVSTVPGQAFGLSPHFWISTAAQAEDLHDACARIVEACARLEEAS